MKEVNLMEFVYETFFATNIMCKRDDVVKKVEVDYNDGFLHDLTICAWS